MDSLSKEMFKIVQSSMAFRDHSCLLTKTVVQNSLHASCASLSHSLCEDQTVFVVCCLFEFVCCLFGVEEERARRKEINYKFSTNAAIITQAHDTTEEDADTNCTF